MEHAFWDENENDGVPDNRYVRCEICCGSGEVVRGSCCEDEYTERCDACDGFGSVMVAVLPVEMDDLETSQQ